MVPSFLLSLREGLEAALIIGVLLGTLRKMRRPDLEWLVWLGTGSAVIVSILVAVFIYLVGASFEGQVEAIFEGTMMLLAAGVLSWMIFWMSRQARTVQTQLETDVRRAALGAGRRALVVVAFLAVVREGIELALFLTAVSFASDATQTLLGAALGIGVVVLLSWGLSASLLKLNIRSFFRVTSVILVVFAAGLVAHGVHELNEAGWVPPIVEHLWDINHLLDETSLPGQILKTLVGYNGNPSLTETLAYLAYFLAVFIGLRWQNRLLTMPQRT
jgi:high-affinity iron transporter